VAGPRAARMAVLVAALGYFVDIYDLILFGVVRRASILGIGVPEAQVLDVGVHLLNMQMGGMLVGGIIWGVLGDKRGRLSVLFGSIILYSLANIANGLVHTVGAYSAVRFIAGLGLAGELGAGITLVSELLTKEWRGYGTAIVATVGICGGIVGATVGDLVNWRTAYFIGGGLGLALLILRIGVIESGMFEKTRMLAEVPRGNLLGLLWPARRLRKYLSVILVGVPIWFVVGALIILSPELGKALGMNPAPSGGRAVLFCYVGLAVGDLASGVLSQIFRSRKKIVGSFILITAIFMVVYFTVGASSLTAFYATCIGLGLGVGYWAVFVTVASEQFGTNIRATVTTTAPNFVRGAVVPINLAVQSLRPQIGHAKAAILVGVIVVSLALIALGNLDETHGKDLDYLER
jgi:MFS transporter, putative metabolite:H+ symporter